MPEAICISVTFLDPRFHGRADGGVPEWPPSPMRLFQALVAGNGPSLGTGSDIVAALRWLEAQPPPAVLAPPSRTGTPCPLYVPNNAMDLVAKGWTRGNNEASIAEHRTLKTARPTHLRGGDTVHYLWPITSNDADPPPVEPLARAVEGMVALGWGIDLVVAQCRVLSSGDIAGEGLERWEVARSHATSRLRCPVPGSLDALMDRHVAFLNRLADDTFHPVPPLTSYRAVGYRRPNDPVARPYRLFKLQTPDGEPYRHPPSRLMHLAGMVRHLAIKQMKRFPPAAMPDGAPLPKDWVEVYIAGHARNDGTTHRQLSYLPLPSLGHRHADPGIRRVMIAAPLGDDALLNHVARRLEGQTLHPERGGECGACKPPMLVSIPRSGDIVTRCYTKPASTWHSFTPVILPGHDDHKMDKRRTLIERALAQAGIEHPCEFEWSPISHFPKAYSAHKHDRAKRPAGFLRPGHLQSQTAVHLTIRFRDGLLVPGPLVVGAGRHCGLGVFAHSQ